jgi:phosphinothricin acetyltransferase
MSAADDPIVRSFGVGDCAAACALTNVFIRETTVHFGDREQTEAEWRDAFAEQVGVRGWPWLVADIGRRFAGYAKAGVWRDRAAYARTAEVAVYVAESDRRRGVGTTLYAALFDELRRRGFHTAIAGITLPNDASVRMHEALGFAPVGTFREVGYKFGGWRDVGFWQLML